MKINRTQQSIKPRGVFRLKSIVMPGSPKSAYCLVIRHPGTLSLKIAAYFHQVCRFSNLDSGSMAGMTRVVVRLLRQFLPNEPRVIKKYFASAKVFLLFAVVVSLTACSSIQKKLSFIPGIKDPNTTKIRSIEVSADQNANQNSAVEMDVLFIMDKNLTATLPTTAADWFDDRSRYLTNNQETIVAANVELPPGGSHKLKMPKGYKKAEDVIAYANYLFSNGQRWLRLTDAKHVSVELQSLHWQSAKKSKK